MEIKKLIKKINNTYDLLKKIPVSIDFYKKYHEYKIYAEKIEVYLKIDKESKEDEMSADEFINDSLYGYVHFKIFPILDLLEKHKDNLFLKLPEDDEIFTKIKHSFLKLGKMDGDTRYEYWLNKTNILFDKFLNDIKTTTKGNNFFIETNIMNAIPEIDELYRHIQEDREQNKTYIERMEENDTYGLLKKIEEMGQMKDSRSVSLRDKGSTDYVGFYDRNKTSKEKMMEPIHIFQALIKEKDIDELNNYFNKYDNQRKIISIGDKKIKLKLKGKDTDGIKLLEILLTDKNKTWYADEIKEAFGYKMFDKITKNKFYYAKNRINSIIEKETNFKDFILGGTKDFSINNKYLKVDG